MIKLEIINKVNGRKFGAKFETQEEADKWKANCVSNNSWGKPDRWETHKKKPKDGWTKKREVKDPIHGKITEYFYPCEYTITQKKVNKVKSRKEKRIDAVKKMDIDKMTDNIHLKKLLTALIQELCE